jgi:DNA-binding response OmpR family regulator
MAKPYVLVVDSDEGFGFMLKDGLENSGRYGAVWVQAGSDALQAIVEQNFDLVIIDIGLPDIPPVTLVKAIRDAKHGMKIMMIPMIGHNLPNEFKSLDINGVLPKPFFVGDLPDLVDKAIGQTKQHIPTRPVLMAHTPAEAGDTTPATNTSGSSESDMVAGIDGDYAPTMRIPVVPQETISFLRANETEVLRLLGDLNIEVRAEAILLTAGLELIAHSGIVGHNKCEELAKLVAQSSQAAAQTASFLGEASGTFTQSLYEGEAYRLYTLTLTEGILLSLALSTNVPLGMLRHQSRQVAEQLLKFII